MTTISDTIHFGPIVTPHGFRISAAIRNVAPGLVRVRGSRISTLWRRAEQLVASGQGVTLVHPDCPHMRLRWRFYGRHITTTQVRALGRLKAWHLRHPESTWAHLKDFGGPSHGDWARLRFWGLVEPQCLRNNLTRPFKRGFWQLTGLGHLWLRGLVKVPRSAALFDGCHVGWINATDLIGPADVDQEFSLAAIMGAA